MKLTTFLRNTIVVSTWGSAAFAPIRQAHAGVFVSITIAPPVLPVYAQPVCPNPGYMWTPGYWAYGPEGYYWVPGVWVAPPSVGVLWTPAWWSFDNGGYVFHAGYWGPHVGFYGGINYGFGYSGVGFGGGEWRGGAFFYNRNVTNVNVLNVTNVYNRTVIVNNHTTIAYNGGPGGVGARPSPQEMAYSRESHLAPTQNQMSHQNFAAQDRKQFASFNHGRPGVPAAASVAAFHASPTNAGLAARPMPNQREASQDQRVAKDVRFGQMNSGGAARTNSHQLSNDPQVRAARPAGGGSLNQGQKQQANREPNAHGPQVLKEKHNARER